MPVIATNQGQVAQDIATAYQALQALADATNGTVQRDLVDASAGQIALAYQALETAREAASLRNVASMDPNALSQFALNFDVLVAPATAATGTVTLASTVPPQSSISIPIGTLVQTQPFPNGTIIQYQTTAAATLTVGTAQNPLTGLYEVNVPVAAVLTGTAYQVGAGALTVLPNRVAGITRSTNKQATGNAYDGDTNATAATNILAKTLGSQIATPAGYQALLLATFPGAITGVAVVPPTDPTNGRVQYGNEVDLPIISVNQLSFTAVLTTSGSITTPFTATRPVLSVSSVTGTTNGSNYLQFTDWGFQRDTAAVYGFSTMSFDALCWFPGGQLGTQPGPGLNLTVQGVYDAGVSLAQQFLLQPTVDYVTGSLLVKSAQKVLINVSVAVSALSGTDRGSLASSVTAALTAALNAYSLGQSVQQDDLINVIDSVAGVASIGVPFTLLNTGAQPTSNVVNVTKYNYARPGAISVTVN
jgi:hypothetical protein